MCTNAHQCVSIKPHGLQIVDEALTDILLTVDGDYRNKKVLSYYMYLVVTCPCRWQISTESEQSHAYVYRQMKKYLNLAYTIMYLYKSVHNGVM